MLDTYIKNRGSTKTIIHKNNHNSINEINWDADYDGQNVNLSLDLTENGKHGHYDVQLDNNDLARLLTIPSVNLPIHKRLERDFQYENNRSHLVDPRMIEYEPMMMSPEEEENEEEQEEEPFMKTPYTHISSPLPNEELLMPLAIKSPQSLKKKSLRYTHKKHHKKHKTYKKTKSRSSRSSKYSRSSSASSSKSRKQNRSSLFF